MLVPATLAWLNGPAAMQPRAALRATACELAGRWARVYFGPRPMQEPMRSAHYAQGAVRQTHRRMMEHLRQRYTLVHEYQRYAQRACESPVTSYNTPGCPPKLLEFRTRLQTHPKAVDQLTPMLASLPAVAR